MYSAKFVGETGKQGTRQVCDVNDFQQLKALWYPSTVPAALEANAITFKFCAKPEILPLGLENVGAFQKPVSKKTAKNNKNKNKGINPDESILFLVIYSIEHEWNFSYARRSTSCETLAVIIHNLE